MFILTSRLNLFNLITKNLYVCCLGFLSRFVTMIRVTLGLGDFATLLLILFLKIAFRWMKQRMKTLLTILKKTCIEYVNLELLYLESYHSRTLMVYTASFHFVKLHNLLECLFLVVSHQFHVGTTSFVLTWQAETPAIPISTLLDLYLWVDVTLLDSCSQFNLSIPLLQLI